MVMATGVLVPVQLENLAVDGMKNLLLAMSETRRDDNRNLELRGIVLTMVNQQLNVTKGLTERLRESLGSQVCRTVIRRNVKLVEAQGNYQDIYDYRQWCPAAIDYDALAKELFD
jgi:chromosome partitioning protein